MRYIVLCVFCSLSFMLQAQVQKVSKQYLNEYFDVCDSSVAKYIATIYYSDTVLSKASVVISNLKDNIVSECYYSNYVLGIKHGECKSYHENGKIKSIAHYDSGLLHGEVLCYFAGGQLKRRDVYKHNILQSGTCYGLNGNEIKYFPYLVAPEYPQGLKNLYKFIYIHTNYPDEAKRLGVKGTVIVRLFINKKGEITKYEIQKSVHPLLDAEALRVCKMLGNFKPGQEDGEYTNSIFVLPIKYEFE
ncbi:MAG TPA: TonB family protein [Bacteroidales bacterium]|nr:TonB family protein [Bacteroidales bacterium]HRS18678.1 TonB family protein [Bacteroidales bacterium]